MFQALFCTSTSPHKSPNRAQIFTDLINLRLAPEMKRVDTFHWNTVYRKNIMLQVLFCTLIPPHESPNRAQILMCSINLRFHRKWSLWPNFNKIPWKDKEIMSRMPFCTPISPTWVTHSGVDFDDRNRPSFATGDKVCDHVSIKSYV